MSHEPQQYCPNCGTANPLSARVCSNCHEPLPSPEEREQLWSTRHEAPLPLQSDPAQPAPMTSPPAPPIPPPPPSEDAPSTAPPPTSPWGVTPPRPPAGSRFDQTRAFPAQPPSGPPPAGLPAQRAFVPPPPPAGNRGVSGWLLGCFAVLIIVAVVVILAVVLTLREGTGSELRGQLENVAATEVAQVDALPLEQDGTLTVTEQQLTNEIQRYADDYGPLTDPTVEITPDRVRVSFDVFGMGNSYEAGVRIANGELQLVNVSGSTVADAVLPASDVATIVEDTVRTLQQRSNVRFTAVELGNGTMTFATVPAEGTPVAGTPRPGTPAAERSAASSAEPATDLSSAATQAVGGTVQSLPATDSGDRLPTATATSTARTATATSRRATSTAPAPTPTSETRIKISD